MIADAMPVFTKAVFEMRDMVTGPESSRKTATLKTYFVGACALQFPALYRKWIKQRSAASWLAARPWTSRNQLAVHRK